MNGSGDLGRIGYVTARIGRAPVGGARLDGRRVPRFCAVPDGGAGAIPTGGQPVSHSDCRHALRIASKRRQGGEYLLGEVFSALTAYVLERFFGRRRRFVQLGSSAPFHGDIRKALGDDAADERFRGVAVFVVCDRCLWTWPGDDGIAGSPERTTCSRFSQHIWFYPGGGPGWEIEIRISSFPYYL